MTSYGLLESYQVPIDGSACKIEKALEVTAGTSARTCDDVEERQRIRVLMEEEVREGKYTQAFFDAIDTQDKDTVQEIKRFWKEDLSHKSLHELRAYFDRFHHIYITTIHPMVLAIYASDLQDVFEKELREIVKDEPGSQEQIIQYTVMLLTPSRLTQVQKEEQYLFELQRSFEGSYPKKTAEEFAVYIRSDTVRAALEKLAETCGWFHMEYIGEPHTAEAYVEQLWQRITDGKVASIELKEQFSPQERLDDILEKQREFFATHECSKFFRDLVFALQEYAIVLDYTKADLIEGIYYARPLLEEIGRRVGLPSWIDVRFLLPQEVRKFLDDGTVIDQAYIAERKRYCTAELKDGVITHWFGDEAKAKSEELLQKEAINDSKEFRGMTAYPGKVRGVATIIMSAQQRGKSRPGQILVTRETTTELTSVIKMSAAIVADHGGLLSHTAIVSREFKIPCIVQTRIATQMIKDGDELEVDASNGIVRILS